MTNCKPIHTPLSVSEKLSLHEGTSLFVEDSIHYRGVVGALQYLTLTRPDISFDVNKVCQFLHVLTYTQLTKVKRILRYLQYTMGLGLEIEMSSSVLVSGFLLRIGQVLLMIGVPLVALLFFLGIILFLGMLTNKPLFLAQA